MAQYRAGLRHHPVLGNTLRGFINLYSSSLDFQMRKGQWTTPINVNLDFKDVEAVKSCSYFLVFPAFEVRLKDGKKYKFVTPDRNHIVSEISKALDLAAVKSE